VSNEPIIGHLYTTDHAGNFFTVSTQGVMTYMILGNLFS